MGRVEAAEGRSSAEPKLPEKTAAWTSESEEGLEELRSLRGPLSLLPRVQLRAAGSLQQVR